MSAPPFGNVTFDPGSVSGPDGRVNSGAGGFAPGGSGGVITGDHADADAGVLAQGDRVLRFLPGRVDDADEGQQLQVGDQRQEVSRRVEGCRVEVASGDGEDAQPFSGHPVVLGEHPIDRVAHLR